jgi:flagellar hook-associated protein 1 FlgK
LEAIVNEPSETGLRQVMDNFWNAWQELSKQPDNIEARAVVRESANALADAFNSVSKKLNDLSADLDDTMSVKTRQIQTLIDQIARLNAEIYRVEALTNNANDLRDQRDLLLDNLSKIVNIAVTEEANGYYVRMGNVELVRGANSAQVTLESLRNAMATGDLNSGEMYGLFYSKDTHVKQLQDELNTMIRTLVNAVNELHHTGYTLKHPVTTGGDFFIIGDPTQPALTVRVNPTMTDEDIAASRRTYTDATGEVRVVRGDNELALLMAGLRSHKFNFSGAGNNVGLSDGTLDEFYRAMVSKLGVQGEEAIRQSDNQRVLVDQIDSRRQSVSGVSLDEEMVNMIRFQHAYNAAARAMTTYDEVLDRIINGMGRVGL